MTYAPAQGHRCEVQILASRDGFNFERIGDRKPWITTGPPGSWNAGMVNAAAPVFHDNKLWIYNSGTAQSHHAANPAGAIGLSHFRPDGYISFDAGETVGSLTTRRMVWTHDELRINAEAPGGEIALEILTGDQKRRFAADHTDFQDHYGPGIEGFTRDDCVPFSGDSLDAPLRFKRASLGQLKGKYVQLRFYLRNARLFSWRFRDREHN